jgi:hypothetical protein
MAVLRRPKLTKREPDQSSWSSSGQPAASSTPASTYVPSQSTQPSGRGVTVHELNAALGVGSGPGGGSLLGEGGGGGGFTPGKGIAARDLGVALTGGGGASANRSVESTRHTSYPQGKGDLNALPVKAGTRSGPRTTSYRIPLQRNAQANVYDTLGGIS